MFRTESTILLVIDVQGKLASLMHDRERLYKHIQAVIKAAQILEIPILWTEQVPEKIGSTVEEVAGLLKDNQPIRKTSFSCWLNDDFKEKLESLGRSQILVCGIETHVCVSQTVSDLIEAGYEVQVVADAVSSRTKENKELALERMKAAGAILTGTEMVVTELLRTSEHKKFKEVLSLIK